MTRFAPIDLARLPPPDVIETLDFELVVERLREGLIAAAPELAPALALESEPAVKVLQVWAYEALRTRARINDAARACMLAYATGGDLDNLAALVGVSRATVPPAGPDELPGLEDDARLRERARLALQAWSNAGPAGAYRYWAFTADARVRDVHVYSPEPGEVRITILPEDPTADPTALLTAVWQVVASDEVRVLTDNVTLVAAGAEGFEVNALISVADLSTAPAVMAAAEAALLAYLEGRRGLGRRVSRSGILAALHVEGVETVALTLPAADVAPGQAKYARCDGIVLNLNTPVPLP